MNRLSSVLTIICLFIFIGSASCITDGNPDNSAGLTVGERLPEFTVEMSDGKIVSSSDFSGCRAVIVFFNTECSDCQRELPRLQQVYERTNGNIYWIAIARDENNEPISKFWAEKKLSIPYSPQTDRHIYNLFASAGIPRLYLTENAVITRVFNPENMPTAEALYQLISTDHQ